MRLKKSRLLLDLSEHLSVERLLAEHPSLTGDSLRGLLREAAGLVGAGELEPAPKAHGKRRGGSYRLYTDGASRGNPGLAGIGAVIEDESGHIVRKLSRFIGTATNNQAEYTALLDALSAAAELGAEELEIFADSELLVKQITGEYKVKNPDLQEKHARARAMLSGFGRFAIRYIPREKNKEADALANEAIDKRPR